MSPLAVIIGANRGIGLEFVKQYKAKGYDVVATCRNKSSELEALSAEVVSGIDTGVDGSCEAIAKYLGHRKADIVVCNSGILRYDDIDHVNLESFKEQLNVNTLGPLRAFMALQKNFKAGSKYCVISSRFGSIDDNSSGSYYGYRTSKAAVNMVGKCLSIDAQRNGVIVGLLHPGFVDTDMTKGASNKTGIITVTESVSSMLQVIGKLTLEVTGQFWNTKGANLPW